LNRFAPHIRSRQRSTSLVAGCVLLGLFIVNPARAQSSLGTAGGYAVDYGVQSQTAQQTVDTVTGTNSVTLGWGTTSSGDNVVVLGTLSNDDGQSNVVSVGDANTGLTRRIINVAPGIASSDAATVGQLDNATSGILSQANSYTDSAISGVLSQANAYTDNSASSTLSSAKSYANSAASSALSSANSYTDSSSAAALSTANTYTDNSSAATLSAAQTYANGIGSSTLTSAETFATNVANSAASSALTAANKYTDTSSQATLGAAETYADTDSATVLTSAETFATNYANGVGTATLTAANQYTDASSAEALATAQIYADNDSTATLSSAEAFATNVGASSLATANKYTDSSSAATLLSANSYTDTVGTTTLNAADNYTYARTQFFAANSLLLPAQASGLETVSLGGGSLASGNNAIAIGSSAQATAESSLAAGYAATVTATGGIALGQNANVIAANSVALGTNSIASRGALAGYTDPISGAVMNSAGEISVGSPGLERQLTNVAAGSAPTDAANVGQVQSAETIAVNLSEAYAYNSTNSLLTLLNNYGYNTSTNNGVGSVAIGNSATAMGTNSSAFGVNSSANANNSVALGAGSMATRGAQSNYKDPVSGNIASSTGEVSVGSPGSERQITNVAPGSAPTDAANVAQVQAAIANADAYTNTMFAKASRQTWSVAAAAEALANLPQAPDPGQSIVGLSMGTSHGQMGVAVGGSYFMPDNRVIIRASGSYSGQGGVSGGMGMGMVLN
jgi:trimeric autotransporter adhesin